MLNAGLNITMLVVTSNTSSPTEVAGDAGILVDPHDATTITNGIKQVISYGQLADQCVMS